MMAKDVMSTSIAEVTASDKCQNAARLMRDRAVGMLIVTTEEGIIEGVLTDRDLVSRCAALGGDPSKQSVAGCMDPHPTTVDAEMELDRAVNVMRNAGQRRLPVTRAGARVVGVLSLDDVAIDLQHYLDPFLAVAEQYARKGR